MRFVARVVHQINEDDCRRWAHDNKRARDQNACVAPSLAADANAGKRVV